VDRGGFIDYVGHPSGGNLEKRINQLIALEPAAPGAAPTEVVEAAIPTNPLG